MAFTVGRRRGRIPIGTVEDQAGERVELGEVVSAKEKLTHYLLVPRRRNDKSGYLLQAGYSAASAERLVADLRELARRGEFLGVGLAGVSSCRR